MFFEPRFSSLGALDGVEAALVLDPLWQPYASVATPSNRARGNLPGECSTLRLSKCQRMLH
jgi:hypothetical protein